MSHAPSPRPLQTLRRLFVAGDVNGDGMLDMGEFGLLVRYVNNATPHETVREGCQPCDCVCVCVTFCLCVCFQIEDMYHDAQTNDIGVLSPDDFASVCFNYGLLTADGVKGRLLVSQVCCCLYKFVAPAFGCVRGIVLVPVWASVSVCVYVCVHLCTCCVCMWRLYPCVHVCSQVGDLEDRSLADMFSDLASSWRANAAEFTSRVSGVADAGVRATLGQRMRKVDAVGIPCLRIAQLCVCIALLSGSRLLPLRRCLCSLRQSCVCVCVAQMLSECTDLEATNLAVQLTTDEILRLS